MNLLWYLSATISRIQSFPNLSCGFTPRVEPSLLIVVKGYTQFNLLFCKWHSYVNHVSWRRFITFRNVFGQVDNNSPEKTAMLWPLSPPACHIQCCFLCWREWGWTTCLHFLPLCKTSQNMLNLSAAVLSWSSSVSRVCAFVTERPTGKAGSWFIYGFIQPIKTV